MSTSNEAQSGKGGSWVITLIKIWLIIFDFISWPIYQILQRPWEKRKLNYQARSELKQTSERELVMRPVNFKYPFYEKMLSLEPKTLDTVWKNSVQRFGKRPFLGTRDILAESDEVQPNGKSFRKLELGDYRWMDFLSVDRTANDLGKGLKALGIKAGERIAILAETRMEYFVTQMACFKHNFPLVTLYTNLGDEAIAFGLNQTKVSFVVTTHDLLPKFHNILPMAPQLKKLVYFENQLHLTDTSGFKNVEVVNFWDVVGSGKRLETEPSVQPEPPKPQDTAIIMYTSGSTGVPKGVIHSHENIFHALAATACRLDNDLTEDDAYLGMLPLAHLLELIVELCLSAHGVKIGYASVNTFLDRSSMVKRGCKGDATLLRPTVLALVPLILERLYKTVNDAVEKKGGVFAQLFNLALDYRRQAHKNGEETPIIDNLVLGNIRALLGGRVRFMLSGGAPLGTVTQDFVKHAFSLKLLQGYGLTETCGCTSVMDPFDESLGCVGGPNPGVVIKLENWEEGNYRVTDKPNPRGEIISGGECVAQGYYEMPEKTAEDFFTDESGVRFMRTGDIGEVQSNGTIKIVDRKKDLVKLQFGEYVSLGKVEACLKTCPVVDNVCVYGDSAMTYPVALLCPDQRVLRERASKLGKADLSFEQLCKDRDVVYSVLSELVKHGKKHRLEKFELPGAVTLCTEIWTPENNFVTAALKLKRKNIQDFYQADLNRMYGASRGV